MAYDPVQSLLAIGTVNGTLHVYGAPGLILSWSNHSACPVKFLSFKSGSSLICCVDDKDTLFGYDLSQILDGSPFREFAHSIRAPVMAIAVSPAHSHMFLGLQDGTVDCFDLDRGVLSPYRIQNFWLHNRLRRSGTPATSGRSRIPCCTDIKLHPLDLNLILVAHEAAVSLYDLKQESVLRSFQLKIPPGAIGSCYSPSDPAIVEERRPSVTCVCFRPDGEMFVSGHSDGCLAFWSLEDCNLPVLVRTIDIQDAMAPVGTFVATSHNQAKSRSDSNSQERIGREPIFRLTWSSSSSEAGQSRSATSSVGGLAAEPRLSELGNSVSQLTILGGLKAGDPLGVHVFHLRLCQPDYQAQSASMARIPGSRGSSVVPIGHYVYFTQHTPEDFLLLPRHSPYFDNSYEPMAIIISVNNCFKTSEPSNLWIPDLPGDTKSYCFSSRDVLAYSFPPSLKEEPQEYSLPAWFDWIGSKSVLVCRIAEISEVAYQTLLRAAGPGPRAASRKDLFLEVLPLIGGRAKSSKLIKRSLELDYQTSSILIEEFSRKRRILVTVHCDQKIRFWDITLALLLPSRSRNQEIDHAFDCEGFNDLAFNHDLKSEFPARLNHLTIDLSSLSAQVQAVDSSLTTVLGPPTDVRLCGESLDLLLTFSSGIFSIHNFREAAQSPSSDSLWSDLCPSKLLSSHDFLTGAQSISTIQCNSRPRSPAELNRPADHVPTSSQTEASPKQSQCPKASVQLFPLAQTTDSTSEKHGHLFSSVQVLPSMSTQDPARASGTQSDDPLLFDLTSNEEDSSPSGGFFPMILVRFPHVAPPDRQHPPGRLRQATGGSSLEPITAFSDLGFLAIVPSSRDRVAVVDVRKSKLLVNDIIRLRADHKHKHKAEAEIAFLGWTIAGTATDNTKFPRLLLGYSDGTFDVITLHLFQHSSIDNWTALLAMNDSFEVDTQSQRSTPNLPKAVFVFDTAGRPITTTLANLKETLLSCQSRRALFEGDDGHSRPNSLHCVSVTVTSWSILVKMNINGPQLLRHSQVSERPIVDAAIISFQGSFALLVIDQARFSFVFTLPKLKPLWNSFSPDCDKLPLDLSVDSSGDVLEYFSPTKIILTTRYFGRDLIYLPDMTVYNPKAKLPEPPQIKSSPLESASNFALNLVSWFQGNSQGGYPSVPKAQLTGNELDQLLAGPCRPDKVKAMPPPRSARARGSTEFAPPRMTGRRALDVAPSSSSKTTTPEGLSQSLNLNDQMRRNFDGLNERGERLKQLSERFDEIALAASEFTREAKRLSQQQSSRATFKSGISGVKSFFK